MLAHLIRPTKTTKRANCCVSDGDAGASYPTYKNHENVRTAVCRRTMLAHLIRPTKTTKTCELLCVG